MGRRREVPSIGKQSRKNLSKAVRATGNHYFNKKKLQDKYVEKIREINNG